MNDAKTLITHFKIKNEGYRDDKKPMRAVANTTPVFRGEDHVMTRRLRWITEHGLAPSMIKGMVMQAITEALKRQFGQELQCIETDFHAFERVLKYAMRLLTEIPFARELIRLFHLSRAEADFYEAH